MNFCKTLISDSARAMTNRRIKFLSANLESQLYLYMNPSMWGLVNHARRPSGFRINTMYPRMTYNSSWQFKFDRVFLYTWFWRRQVSECTVKLRTLVNLLFEFHTRVIYTCPFCTRASHTWQSQEIILCLVNIY